MCNTCDDGICTNGCLCDVAPVQSDFQELAVDLQALMLRIRSQIVTYQQYCTYTALLSQQLQGYAAVLTVFDPAGVQTFIDPQFNEVDNENLASVYFVPTLAQKKAELLNAEIELL